MSQAFNNVSYNNSSKTAPHLLLKTINHKALNEFACISEWLEKFSISTKHDKDSIRKVKKTRYRKKNLNAVLCNSDCFFLSYSYSFIALFIQSIYQLVSASCYTVKYAFLSQFSVCSTNCHPSYQSSVISMYVSEDSSSGSLLTENKWESTVCNSCVYQSPVKKQRTKI